MTARATGTAARISLLILALSVPASAAERADPFLGEWEQIASDAGACPACRVTFKAGAGGLTVRANNGWAATLGAVHGGEFSGSGRWDATVRGWPAGLVFTVGFRRDGDRLRMTMTIELGPGSTRIVSATYGRPWQGV